MSRAKEAFDSSIKDAEQLLDHCNSLGHPLPQSAEVFKRAGLVMALTAWETFEGVTQRVSAETTHAEKFMLSKLDEELKRFNTPATDKTRELFWDYLRIDVTSAWHWADDSARRSWRDQHPSGCYPFFGMDHGDQVKQLLSIPSSCTRLAESVPDWLGGL